MVNLSRQVAGCVATSEYLAPRKPLRNQGECNSVWQTQRLATALRMRSQMRCSCIARFAYPRLLQAVLERSHWSQHSRAVKPAQAGARAAARGTLDSCAGAPGDDGARAGDAAGGEEAAGGDEAVGVAAGEGVGVGAGPAAVAGAAAAQPQGPLTAASAEANAEAVAVATAWATDVAEAAAEPPAARQGTVGRCGRSAGWPGHVRSQSGRRSVQAEGRSASAHAPVEQADAEAVAVAVAMLSCRSCAWARATACVRRARAAPFNGVER